MEFFSILEKECCSIGLKAADKEDVLKQLAALAKKSRKLDDFSEQKIFEGLRDREAQGSTGFGDGIALPHFRLKGLKDFLVFIAVSSQGVDFGSLDRKKVHLLFVIIAPEEKVSQHVQVLAAVSRAVATGTLKRELTAARSEGVVYETFLRHVQQTADSIGVKRKMKMMYVILYLDDLLYHVLEYFIQEGIDGATIVESSGMGQYISDIPLYASFIGFLNQKRNHSKTIMALIPEDREQEILSGIEDITGDLDKKEGAMVITLDVSFYKGSMRMM